MGNPAYGLTANLGRTDFSAARERVAAALKDEGFGVLTEIDVRATLKQKIDVDFRDYLILGACNPPLAHRALSADPAIGLLLPCNIVIYRNDAEEIVVQIGRPTALFTVVDAPGADQLAAEVEDRMRRVIAAL
ncbi:MAG: DUF302 domain-containing protein [Polyangia bacterium]